MQPWFLGSFTPSAFTPPCQTAIIRPRAGACASAPCRLCGAMTRREGGGRHALQVGAVPWRYAGGAADRAGPSGTGGRRYRARRLIHFTDPKHRPAYHCPGAGPAEHRGRPPRLAILGGRRAAGICRRQSARRAGRGPSGPDRPGQPGRPVCGGPVRRSADGPGQSAEPQRTAAAGRAVLERGLAARCDPAVLRRVRPPGTPERGRCVPRADPLAGGRRGDRRGRRTLPAQGQAAGRTGVPKPPRYSAWTPAR